MSAAYNRVLKLLHGVKPQGVGRAEALCPAHEDTKPSLSISGKNGKVLLKCHAGCHTEDVLAAIGLTMADLFDSPPPYKANARSEIVGTYDYTDEAGRLLSQTVRFRPKGFAQRRPDEAGGWVWDLKGVRRVPYRLSKVLEAAARGQRVYKVEGEKDVHALEALGLVATTNAEGAGKWRRAHSETLRGAHVVILPDNDGAGRKDGEQVARSLHGVAASVRVVHLAGLPDKGDVSDWLAAGHTREELEALADATPEWTPQQTTPGGFRPTDLGNAERLIAAHGDGLRYHVHTGHYLRWTGKVWAEDETGEVHRLMNQTVRRMIGEAASCPDLKEQDALLRHALKSESAQRLEAAVNRARWLAGIPVRATELDRDPWALNVLNGTLNLRTGTRRPHDPKELHTKLAPVVFEPDAACPRWAQFLAEVFPDEPELPEYTRRLAGCLLTGDVSEQGVYFPVGKGANGKGVFIETLRAVLGDYARDTPFATLLETHDTSTNDLAALVGARLVTASEGSARQTFNEGMLKRLSGGDPVTCRFLHREFFTYYPTYKIVCATNEVPRFTSQAYSIRRRVHIIPFRRTFYAQEEGKEPVRDEGLKEHLRAEASGILNWALRGCIEWQEGGLRPPAVVRNETAALFDTMDPLADFIDSECVLHPGARVTTGSLFGAYRRWCDADSRPSAFRSQNAFTRTMAGRDGIEYKPMRDGRYLVGIGLRELSFGAGEGLGA